MKRLAVLAAALATLALPASAFGGAITVDVEDNFFDPTPLTTNFSTGLAVVWDWGLGTNDTHNVRQDDKLFRSGAPTMLDADYAITPSVGTFHYYCEVHGSPNGGMDGVLRTRPSFEAAPAGDPFRVSWAPPKDGSNPIPGNRFDIQFRVNDGNWQPWFASTAKRKRVFGANGQPVTVNPANDYSFRGRSKLAGTDRRSGFSPKLTVQP